MQPIIAFRRGRTVYPAKEGRPDYEHGETFQSINAAKRHSRELGLGAVRALPRTPAQQRDSFTRGGGFRGK